MKEAHSSCELKKKKKKIVVSASNPKGNRKKDITSQIHFHLDSKKTQRNIIMEIFWVCKEGPKKDTCTV